MAHKLLREQAIQLRLQGCSYGQIKSDLNIQKSTLSGWLKNFPLTPEQLEKLAFNKQSIRAVAVERYIQPRKAQRKAILTNIYNQQSNELLPLSERELFIAGVFLYWGEGEKRHGIVSVSNTDPRIMKFSLFWMTQIMKVPLKKIKILLHLYKDMDINESINFWSNHLNFPKNQFAKPYIKKSNIEGLTYKGFGHGTCKLYICSVELSERIAMSIKAISDKYGAKDDIFWYN